MKGAALARALAAPDPAIRCYLFYGADEAGSRALAAQLAAGIGDDAERIDLSPAQLKGDPALLADEAAAVSLFGGRRWIRVEGAGDDCVAAVEALLSASAAGNPVALVAGALRKDARLVKRLSGDPAALVVASYPLDDVGAGRLAIGLAREAGLAIDEEIVRRLLEAAAGDRAVLASELEKLALYAGATPEAPVRAGHAMLDAIGAGAAESDPTGIVDALFGGDTAALDRQLSLATPEDGVPTVRAVLRRGLAIAAVRAEMDRGLAPKAAADRAGRQLFWKERDAVMRDVRRWPSRRIAAAIDGLAALERSLKSSGGGGAVAMRQALVEMARTAAGRGGA